MRLRDGDWFNRQDLAALRRAYRDLGYPWPENSPEIVMDREHSTLDIVVPIKRGPRVTVDRVVIDGAGDVPLDRIRRVMEIAEGSFYDETKVNLARERLLALGPFVHVEMWWKGTADDPRWTLKVELTRRH